jgi:hypothetical protein
MNLQQPVLLALLGMVATYLALVEFAKWWFYRRWPVFTSELKYGPCRAAFGEGPWKRRSGLRV